MQENANKIAHMWNPRRTGRDMNYKFFGSMYKSFQVRKSRDISTSCKKGKYKKQLFWKPISEYLILLNFNLFL